jgi:hypothetical protein
LDPLDFVVGGGVVVCSLSQRRQPLKIP